MMQSITLLLNLINNIIYKDVYVVLYNQLLAVHWLLVIELINLVRGSVLVCDLILNK